MKKNKKKCKKMQKKCKKICTYQKKVVPLHRNSKKELQNNNKTLKKITIMKSKRIVPIWRAEWINFNDEVVARSVFFRTRKDAEDYASTFRFADSTLFIRKYWLK